MSLFKFFKTDPVAEAEGNLFTLQGPDGLPVFRVRLRRMGGANSLFDKVRERVFEPYRAIISELDNKFKEKLTHRVFAEAVTVPGSWEMYEREGMTCGGSKFENGEWAPEVPKSRTADGFVKGICNEHDEIVADTIENVAHVLSELPDIYALLLIEAGSADSYRLYRQEQDSKN